MHGSSSTKVSRGRYAPGLLNFQHDPEAARGPLLNRAACTIVSPKLHRLWRERWRPPILHSTPAHRFFVLIVADLHDPAPFHAVASLQQPFTIHLLTEIAVPELRAAAMKYDILELNTNVKPTFLKFLLDRYALDQLVYLDPDIFRVRTAGARLPCALMPERQSR